MVQTKTVGVAVIGLGTVGLRYVEQFNAHNSFDFVGGFDISEQASRHAKDRFEAPLFESAHSLLTDDRVDLVYVATPPLQHLELVTAVTQAGKALLCEKPLGVTAEDSQTMVDLVTASAAPAAVNFVFGAAPAAQDLAEAIGRRDVASCDLRVHFEQWPRAWQANATWLRDRNQGGWVREVVSHYLFLAMRLFGPLSIESSHLSLPSDGSSEDGLVALLRAGSVRFQIVGTSDSAGTDEVVFTARGRDESWRLVNWYEFERCERGRQWESAIAVDRSGGSAAYAAQLDAVAAMVHGQSHALASFGEAFAVQQCAEALLSASDESV